MKLMQLVIWLDQGANVLLGGWADETISARAWRQSDAGKRRWDVARRVIDAVFRAFGQRDHCFEVYNYEMLRGGLPPQYRVVPVAPIWRVRRESNLED